MEQLALVHEDIYEALRTCVQALGGAKKVGAQMWPELSPDKAGNRLNDALNPAKRDVLNPEQMLLILKQSRKVNCHVGMYFMTDECNYQRPAQLEPDNELIELQRAYVQSVRDQKALADRMDQMLALKAVTRA